MGVSCLDHLRKFLTSRQLRIVDVGVTADVIQSFVDSSSQVNTVLIDVDCIHVVQNFHLRRNCFLSELSSVWIEFYDLWSKSSIADTEQVHISHIQTCVLLLTQPLLNLWLSLFLNLNIAIVIRNKWIIRHVRIL